MAFRLCVSYLFICICDDLPIRHFNELSPWKCIDISLRNYFLGSVRGQMRTLKAGTLTTALGNFVTFAVSFLYVQINQTSGWDGAGVWTTALRTRLGRFLRERIRLGTLDMPWGHSPETRVSVPVLLLFCSIRRFVHLKIIWITATCLSDYVVNRLYQELLVNYFEILWWKLL